MANRVLLNSSALRVSQAGANVLTASPAQLLFSSDWSAMTLAQVGTYTVSSWSGSGDLRAHNGSITLSKTYPSPPAVAFYLINSGSYSPVGFGSGCFFGWLRNAGSGDCSALCHFQVGNSSITVAAMYDKQATPSLAVPSWAVRYFVFDFNT